MSGPLAPVPVAAPSTRPASLPPDSPRPQAGTPGHASEKSRPFEIPRALSRLLFLRWRFPKRSVAAPPPRETLRPAHTENPSRHAARRRPERAYGYAPAGTVSPIPDASTAWQRVPPTPLDRTRHTPMRLRLSYPGQNVMECRRDCKSRRDDLFSY